MITYEQAKIIALSNDASYDSVRDLGIGWAFEKAGAEDESAFFMVKKNGEILMDILDFIEEYMLLSEKTDILLDFESGERA